MLKVIPMSDPREQERVCLTSGIAYDKNQFAYGMYEDDEIIGACQFYVKDGIGYLSDLKTVSKEEDKSLALAMLLGRWVRNFLDLHGTKEAYFEKNGELYDRVARAIGFKNKEGRHYAFLDGMFTAHEH